MQSAKTVSRKSDGVAIAVVFDAVAAAHDVPDDLWIRCGLVSDAEEAGLRFIAIQQIENPRRNRRVGTIIEGERDLAARYGRRRQTLEVGPEQGAARHHHA